MKAWLVAGWICLEAIAGAAECRMKDPVHVGNMNLLKGLVLREARFAQTPKFLSDVSFDPTADALSVSLFEITYGSQPTGYLGGRVFLEKKDGSLGFPGGYIGSFNLEGGMTQLGQVTIFQTKHVAQYTEPQHAKNDALTQLQVEIKEGYLTQFRLTVPEYKIWKKVGSTTYLAFTGRHQELCLLGAR